VPGNATVERVRFESPNKRELRSCPPHDAAVTPYGDTRSLADARLAKALRVPIAVGETIYTAELFREFLEQGAVEIVQADVTKLSGIDEWLEVAALAKRFGIPVIPHTNVQQKVHVQLAAATPHAPMVECCYESLADIWKEPLTVETGFYNLPTEPGVGCEFDSLVLKQYRVG